jgi:hypothetical protein
MTIEFLRARLQAERTASKTVKGKMEQISKKVCHHSPRAIHSVMREELSGDAHLQSCFLE